PQVRLDGLDRTPVDGSERRSLDSACVESGPERSCFRAVLRREEEHVREFPTLGVEDAGILAAGSKRIVLVHRKQFLERDEGVIPEGLRAAQEVAAYKRFTRRDFQAREELRDPFSKPRRQMDAGRMHD